MLPAKTTWPLLVLGTLLGRSAKPYRIAGKSHRPQSSARLGIGYSLGDSRSENSEPGLIPTS
jgi:hypothetical protein